MTAETTPALTILYEGAREVLGAESMQMVRGWFSTNGPVPPLKEARSFLSALEAVFGPVSGQGLALRIGRAAFRYGLPLYGDQAGFRAVEYRLLPAPRRLENGLHALARLLTAGVGGAFTVTDEGGHWLCRYEDAAETPADSSQSPLSFFFHGLLQEFTLWAGGGRFYRVTEIPCAVQGCRGLQYRVDKKPLD